MNLSARIKEGAHRLGTAVTTVTGFGASRDEGWLPGRIFILHTISMGLDNYPIPCPSGKRSLDSGIPQGFTHRPSERCPFQEAICFGGSCCWLRGKVAARELDALGENALSSRMYDDMTAEEAIEFGRDLLFRADALERDYHGKPKPKGAGWNSRLDEKRNEVVWDDCSTFEEALARIREAGRWFEEVGRLGFGVHAWS